jgi:hypothetical protein
MQKYMMVILCLVSLSACTSQYGNYTKMADDSARELMVLYPPASTHLTLSQTTIDAYGAELVKKLRENSYALEEESGFRILGDSPAPATAGGNITARSNLKGTEISAVTFPAKTDAPVAAVSSNTSFGYVIDQVGEGLYRVKINIGSKVISRVYKVSSKGIAPAGSWTRKE